jgi:hypothetical protein
MGTNWATRSRLDSLKIPQGGPAARRSLASCSAELARAVAGFPRSGQLSLHDRREWYNSLLSNCTTNLFYHRNRQVGGWFKIGVFVNGLSARTLFHSGLLDRNLSFRELEARSEIRELGLAAGNASDFTLRIRLRIADEPNLVKS